VQLQKISLLLPWKGLEFLGGRGGEGEGFCKTKKLKDMYGALLKFPGVRRC